MNSNQAQYLLKCASLLVKQAGPMDWLQSAGSAVGNAFNDAGSAIGKAVYDSPLVGDGAAKRESYKQPWTPPPQRGRGIVGRNPGGLGWGNLASHLRNKQKATKPAAPNVVRNETNNPEQAAYWANKSKNLGGGFGY